MKSQILMGLLLSLLPFLSATAAAQATEAAGSSPQAVPAAAGAPEAGQSGSAPSRWQLGIAIGYGLRTNPLIQSDDIPIIVDLDISWFGDHFFFDDGDLGLTIVNNDYLTTSLVARINSDRVFFGRTNTRFVRLGAAGEPLASPEEVSVPDRDYAVELGVEVLSDGPWGFLQAAAYHDVSDTHQGYQVEFEYGYGWRNQRFYLEPSVGVSFKSADLNNYYWGVAPGEINASSPGYDAGSGVNAYARAQLSYQITRNWTLTLVGEVERLNDEAANSPIVARQNVYAYFAGFGYRFR